MKGGFLIYKCRRCGQQYQYIHSPNLHLTLVNLANGFPTPKEWLGIPLALTDIHHCADKPRCMGVADLVGGEEDA